MELLNEDWSDHHDRILYENTDMAAIEAIVRLAEVKLDAHDVNHLSTVTLT